MAVAVAKSRVTKKGVSNRRSRTRAQITRSRGSGTCDTKSVSDIRCAIICSLSIFTALTFSSFVAVVDFKEEHGHTNVPKEFTYRWSPVSDDRRMCYVQLCTIPHWWMNL